MMAPSSCWRRESQARGAAVWEREEAVERAAAVYQEGAGTRARALANSMAVRGTWAWTEERNEESWGEGRAPKDGCGGTVKTAGGGICGPRGPAGGRWEGVEKADEGPVEKPAGPEEAGGGCCGGAGVEANPAFVREGSSTQRRRGRGERWESEGTVVTSREAVRKWGEARSSCPRRWLATRQASATELWVSRRTVAALATPIQESRSRGRGVRLSRRT